MYYVYILKCGDGSLYTGWTTNVRKRIEQHSLGKGARYTRSRLPVELVYKEKLPSQSEALKREYEIKQFSRIEKMILIQKRNTRDFTV